jgi:hypothetical protein
MSHAHVFLQHDERPYVKSILIEPLFIVAADGDRGRQRCHFDVLPIVVAEARCHSTFVFLHFSKRGQGLDPAKWCRAFVALQRLKPVSKPM